MAKKNKKDEPKVKEVVEVNKKTPKVKEVIEEVVEEEKVIEEVVEEEKVIEEVVEEDAPVDVSKLNKHQLRHFQRTGKLPN